MGTGNKVGKRRVPAVRRVGRQAGRQADMNILVSFFVGGEGGRQCKKKKIDYLLTPPSNVWPFLLYVCFVLAAP